MAPTQRYTVQQGRQSYARAIRLGTNALQSGRTGDRDGHGGILGLSRHGCEQPGSDNACGRDEKDISKPCIGSRSVQ